MVVCFCCYLLIWLYLLSLLLFVCFYKWPYLHETSLQVCRIYDNDEDEDDDDETNLWVCRKDDDGDDDDDDDDDETNLWVCGKEVEVISASTSTEARNPLCNKIITK